MRQALSWMWLVSLSACGLWRGAEYPDDSPAVQRVDGTPPPAPLSVTFIANEGVLLAHGRDGVLIDALFREFGPGFQQPTDSTREAMETARGQFGDVKAVLVTHHHGDHFHRASVAAHLASNPGAVLLTSQQVLDSLMVPLHDPVRSRLRGRQLAPGQRHRERIGNVSVEVLGLPHAGTRSPGVDNVGFLVDIGGKRVLHIGDAAIRGPAFEQLRLDTANVDLALVHSILVTTEEGRGVLQRWINPRAVAVLHVGTGQEEQMTEAVKRAWPSARVLTRPLASFTLP